MGALGQLYAFILNSPLHHHVYSFTVQLSFVTCSRSPSNSRPHLTDIWQYHPTPGCHPVCRRASPRASTAFEVDGLKIGELWEGQGQLSSSYGLRDSSPNFHRWMGPGARGQMRKTHFCAYNTSCQMSGGASYLVLSFSWLAHLQPHHQDQCHCAGQVRCKTFSPESCSQ